MNIYTIKIALRGISPMIWRRLRIPGETTIAGLHHIIQISMGWDDAYLHCFHIYGKDYGIVYAGGLSFSDNPQAIKLEDFGFDPGDRFTYTYNFNAPWLSDIRIEVIEPISRVPDVVPYCIGGSRRHGADAVDEHHAYLKVLDKIVTSDDMTTIGELQVLIEDFDAVRFNRRSINTDLAAEYSRYS